MTAKEKNAARHAIERKVEQTVLGSDEWWETLQELRRFDREHPNLWADDPEEES